MNSTFAIMRPYKQDKLSETLTVGLASFLPRINMNRNKSSELWSKTYVVSKIFNSKAKDMARNLRVDRRLACTTASKTVGTCHLDTIARNIRFRRSN